MPDRPIKLMRTDRSWGRTLVEHAPGDPRGQLVGVADTAALAREIADAINASRTGALLPDAATAVRQYAAALADSELWCNANGMPRTDDNADTIAAVLAKIRINLETLATELELGPYPW